MEELSEEKIEKKMDDLKKADHKLVKELKKRGGEFAHSVYPAVEEYL